MPVSCCTPDKRPVPPTSHRASLYVALEPAERPASAGPNELAKVNIRLARRWSRAAPTRMSEAPGSTCQRAQVVPQATARPFRVTGPCSGRGRGWRGKARSAWPGRYMGLCPTRKGQGHHRPGSYSQKRGVTLAGPARDRRSRTRTTPDPGQFVKQTRSRPRRRHWRSLQVHAHSDVIEDVTSLTTTSTSPPVMIGWPKQALLVRGPSSPPPLRRLQEF